MNKKAIVEDTPSRRPGLDLHELSGHRKGTWPVKISGKWRVTFTFEGEDVTDVDYEDYH